VPNSFSKSFRNVTQLNFSQFMTEILRYDNDSLWV